MIDTGAEATVDLDGTQSMPFNGKTVTYCYIRKTCPSIDTMVNWLPFGQQAYNHENTMEINQTSNRIHPLVAGAAASVILVSLLGAAALTGVLPSSHAAIAPTPPVEAQASTPISGSEQQTAEHKVATHHRPVQQTPAEITPQYPQTPVHRQPAPVAHNSPLGIGIGAVVGGLLGNQVGGGNGKTLATIAGAVGGGYVGNEIAKGNP